MERRPSEIPDYYERLGISRDAGEDEIKRAYRREAKLWHPDRHPEDVEGSRLEFVAVGEAYERVSCGGDSYSNKTKNGFDFRDAYDYYDEIFRNINEEILRRASPELANVLYFVKKLGGGLF